MCLICNRLRFAWYATATPIKTLNVSPAIVVKVHNADRRRPEYTAALKAYKEHRKVCEYAAHEFDEDGIYNVTAEYAAIGMRHVQDGDVA